MYAAARAWRIVATSRWKSGQHLGGRPSIATGTSWRAFAQPAEVGEEEVATVDEKKKGKSERRLADYCLRRPSVAVPRIQAWAKRNVLTNKSISETIEVLYVHQKFTAALEVLEFARSKTDFDYTVDHVIRELTITTRKYGSLAGQTKLDNLPDKFRNDDVVKGTYLRCLTQINAATKALSVINTLQPTSTFLYSSIMSVYSYLAMHDKMLALFTEMKEQGLKPSLEIYMLMLLKYQKRVGDLAGIEDQARAILKETDPQAVEPTSRNYMLEMYGYLGDRDKVEEIWNITKNTPGKIFRNCYFSAMLAFCYLGDVSRAEELLEESVKKMDVIPGRNQYLRMLDLYCKLGMMDKAEKVFEERAKDEFRTFYPCNALVEGYLSVNETDKALKKMEELGSTRPSYEVVMGLLPVFERKKDLVATKKLIRSYLFYYRGDVHLYNRMLKVYVAAERRPDPRMLSKFVIDPNEETGELMKIVQGFSETEETEGVDDVDGENVEKRLKDMPVNEKPRKKKEIKSKETEASPSPKKQEKTKWSVLQSLF